MSEMKMKITSSVFTFDLWAKGFQEAESAGAEMNPEVAHNGG
jgi:hypothetical protein